MLVIGVGVTIVSSSNAISGIGAFAWGEGVSSTKRLEEGSTKFSWDKISTSKWSGLTAS